MQTLPAPMGPLAIQAGDRFPLLAAGSLGAARTTAGDLVATFVLLRHDRRRDIATYAFRVFNFSSSEAVCVLYGLTSYGAPALAHPVPIRVPSNTKRETEISFPVRGFGSFERVLAEVRSETALFTVEAPSLPQPPISRVSKISLALSILLALVCAAALALQRLPPRIAGFSLPPSALAGSTVDAEYATGGIGQLSYSVDDPNGKRLAEGPLTDRTGAIRFALPQSGDAVAYTMRLLLTGPFGSTSEARVVNAVPPPKPKIVVSSGAQISNIEVDPIVAHPGDLIHIKYSASASDGYVRLLDSQGTIWSQFRSSRDGSTWMRVPLFDTDREMRVLLHVKRGTSVAQSSAGLIVIASKDELNSDSAPSKDTGAENGIFSIASTKVRSGGTIKIHVLTPRDGLRIALTDTASNEISGVEVGLDQDVIYLHAPSVQVAGRYVIVASFRDGFGEESVVAPVVVAP